MNPYKIPDLHWHLADMHHATNIGQSELHISNMTTQSMDVQTLSHAGGRKYENACGATLNTDTNTLNSTVYTIVCFINNKA